MVRPLRFAGHPLHPPLVHFPIAAWTMSSVADGIALIGGGALWWQMGFWCLVCGWIVALPAILGGLLDSRRISEGDAAETPLQRHMWIALSAASAYGMVLLLHTGEPPTGSDRWILLALSAVGLALLMLAGWLGGELVYRFGVGLQTGAARLDRHTVPLDRPFPDSEDSS